MNTKGNWKRILAAVLSFTMVISGLQYVGNVSKAATSYSGSFTLEGSQVNANSLVDLMGVNTNLYLKGDAGLDQVPLELSEGQSENWSVIYSPTDDNSGIFLDGKKVAGGKIRKYWPSNNWWFADGFSASAGQTLTIKGEFVNGDTTVNITECSFIYDGSRFAPAKETANYSLVDLIVKDNNGMKGFYVRTQQKGVNVNDGMEYNGNWSITANPVLAAYSGVIVDGKYWPIGMKKLDEDVYYVAISDKLAYDADGSGTLEAEEWKVQITDDTVLAIRGQFIYNGYIVDFNETLFHYDTATGTWSHEKVLPSGALSIAGNQVGTSHTAINNAGIYLGGDDVLDSAIKAPADDDWSDKLVGMTEADGIFLNGNKIEGAKLMKYSNTNNWWYVESIGGAQVGDIVTIKGDFMLKSNNTPMINIKESKFKWNGSFWTTYRGSGCLLVEGAQVVPTTNPKMIYLKGSDSLGEYELGITGEDWTQRLYAVGTDDGVFLNGTKVEGATVFKYSDKKNYWFTEGFSAVEGDIVTVKGDFGIGDTKDYIVTIEESKFQYTGGQWVDYTEDATVYTSFAVNEIHENTSVQREGTTWHFYLKTDTELPGTAWGSVNDVSEYFAMSATVNGTAITLNAKKWDKRGLFLEIPVSQLPSDAEGILVVKAGKYKSNVQDIGYDLTEDINIYISEMGVSLKQILKPALDTKPLFAVDAENGSNSEKGFVLTINTDDGAPYNTDWTKRLYPVQAGLSEDGQSLLLSAGENGLWEGDTYTGVSVPLVKITKSTYYVAMGDKGYIAEAGDTYTFGGIFYDENYRFIDYTPITVTWDGSKWSQVLGDAEYSDITITELTSLDGYNEENEYWDLYFKVEDAMVGTEWTTVYPDLEVYVDDTRIYPLLKYVSATSLNFFIKAANGLPGASDLEVGTRLTIKASASRGFDGNFARVDGINLTADYIMEWDGSQWTTPAEWTSFTVSGLNVNTVFQTSVCQTYLYTSETLPGDAWGKVNETPESYKVKVSVNGTEQTVTAKKWTTNGLFLEIPTSLLAQGDEATVIIKAGKYRSNVQNIGLDITSDFTIYTNKYGWSTNGPLELAMTSKPRFSLEVNAAETTESGFVLNINMSDGTPEAVSWSTRLFPVMKSVSDDKQTLYYTSNEYGLWKNGVHITTRADGSAISSVNKPLVKLSDTRYYVGIGDWGYTAEDGDRYTLGGVFYDSTGRLIEYQPITVEYNASTGKWQGVYTPLTDSGVTNDVNSDGAVDSRDLVRFKCWEDNNLTSLNDTRADVNLSGSTNAKDVASMRKILVGKLFYNGTDRVPYGVPYYTKGEKIEKLAYASPSVGTYDSETQVYTRRSDEAAIDADFEKFKAAGLTLLNSENRATLSVEAWDHVSNTGIKEYLVEAKEHGLGVIVYCEYLQLLLKGSVDMTEAAQGTTYDYRWQEIMAHYVSNLSAYPAFKGFMMSDELTIAYIDNYRAVASFLRTNYPGLMLHSSQLPVSAYTVEGLGAGSLTTDTTTNSTKELAYRDYVYNFGMASGHYTYDLYPLTVKTEAITQKKTYGVNSEWYDNLKWVAEERKENGYAFDAGITIQSCALPLDETNWWQSSTERYAPTSEADIGFQIYTALAYGMDEINFFTYEDHWNANVTDAMADNTSVYSAVQTVNGEIDAFGYMFKAFEWKETLDIAAGSSSSTSLSPRLASASVSGGRTFVGCMQDEEGFDGYMIANATGPQTGTSASVTLTFNDATKAIVYKNGVKSIVTLTDGAYTVSVGVGEGVFVIPYREIQE